jgi:predicted permease
LSSFLYSLLLRLLPRHRRERYADEMTAVFARQLADARRHRLWRNALALWMRDLMGLARFVVRERTAAMTAMTTGRAGGRWNLRFEFQSAVRHIRTRRWQAVFLVGLLAVALAANAIVFAAADALVFNATPYRAPDHLVAIAEVDERRQELDEWIYGSTIAHWRRQHDLFAGVHGYLADRWIFLSRPGGAEFEHITSVTAGLIDMLGVAPRWGRLLVDADTTAAGVFVVVVSESLARDWFGTAAAAVGQRITTTHTPLHVVGVMPETFRFPTNRSRIWRVLDPTGPLTRTSAGVKTIARLAPGVAIDAATSLVRARGPAIAGAAGQRVVRPYTLTPFGGETVRSADLLFYLSAAAICLLCTACASVASIELTNLRERARIHAIHLALGASRRAIVRTALLERALLIVAAAVAAAGLASAGTAWIAAQLPSPLRFVSPNPIDLDARGLWFMTAAAAVTWLIASLPSLWLSGRSALTPLLESAGRGSAGARPGTAMRRALTMAEVAMAVTLLVCSGLAVRSYATAAAVDRGFDIRNLARVSIALPDQVAPERGAIVTRVTDRIRNTPGVRSAAVGPSPPEFGYASGGTIEVEGIGVVESPMSIAEPQVDGEYFRVVSLPIERGRLLAPGETDSNAVISTDLATALWTGDPIGRRFRRRATEPWRTVVGVVRRPNPVHYPGAPSRPLPAVVFIPPQPRPPVKPLPPDYVDTGGSVGYAEILVRLERAAAATPVLEQARQVDPRVSIDLELMEEHYLRGFASLEFSASVVGAFGGVAMLVAMAGLYGVMTFLVASRRREIGVRMALGAAPHDVRRWIVGSSLRLAAAGAAVGVGGALAATGWLRSVVPGIATDDGVAYGVVAAGVLLTAMVATWWPARQAARVDPAIVLRAE